MDLYSRDGRSSLFMEATNIHDGLSPSIDVTVRAETYGFKGQAESSIEQKALTEFIESLSELNDHEIGRATLSGVVQSSFFLTLYRKKTTEPWALEIRLGHQQIVQDFSSGALQQAMRIGFILSSSPATIAKDFAELLS